MIRIASLSVVLASAVALFGSPAPDDLATIERECGARLKLPPGGCACIGKRAAALSEGQQAFIAAALTKDKAAQAQIMQSLTVAELTEAGTFMANAPVQCGQGG